MGNEDHGGNQDQLEEHSLPGTNQAGKGPSSCEKDEQENRPDGGGRRVPTGPRNTALPAPTKPEKALAHVENDRAAC